MNKNTSPNLIQVGGRASSQLTNTIFPRQLYFAVDIQNEQVLHEQSVEAIKFSTKFWELNAKSGRNLVHLKTK